MKNYHFISCLLCVLFLLAGCSDDKEKIVDRKENHRIQLFFSDMQEVQVYSTAAEPENYIEDCFVVTFSGGLYKKSEKIDVSGIVKNSMAAAILPQLSFDIDLGDKVYVICNTGLTALPAGINTESDIDDKFKPAKDYYFGGEALPMSGSIVWSMSSYVVTLIRAVAKVQIKIGEGFNIGGDAFYPNAYWRIEDFNESQCGFVIGNYGGKSNILQNASALSQNRSGLSAFYGTTSEEKFIRFMQHAGSMDSTTIYISEYPNSTKDCEGNTIADDVFNEKRHFLLMLDKVSSDGGSLLGNGMVTSAWRLDFYDVANKKYLDIKRNHHYIFTVNKIRSAPYLYWVPNNWATISTTFQGDQEVWHNPGSNIEYTIYVQNNWVNATFSNGQYAVSASADTIRDANVPFRLKVEVPPGVDLSQTTTHILNIYNRLGQQVGNTGDELEVLGFPTPGTSGIDVPTDGTTLTLNFKVNDDQYLDSAYMIVRVGNIYKKIMILLAENWIYMPDPGFREYCNQKGFLSKIKTSDNRYVQLSPAGKAAGTITIQRNLVPFGTYCGSTVNLPSDVNTSLYTAVSDLTGLEAFKNLEYLYIGGNNITTIDVSANTKLKVLSSYGTPVTSANLSNNRELFLIFLSINSILNTLDISYCSPNMCFLAGKANELIWTTQQNTNLGSGIMGSFTTRTYVPSPY
ncbi:MAG: hypothetical protein LBV74_16055 [Tannerella sp.]|nr:hypothetical protein [Tannerella sp.]